MCTRLQACSVNQRIEPSSTFVAVQENELDQILSTGAPMSWRAVLGGEPEPEVTDEPAKPEETQLESQIGEATPSGRGRGRGRGRREQAPREERQEAGRTH